jgi:hypothetical protein
VGVEYAVKTGCVDLAPEEKIISVRSAFSALLLLMLWERREESMAFGLADVTGEPLLDAMLRYV